MFGWFKTKNKKGIVFSGQLFEKCQLNEFFTKSHDMMATLAIECTDEDSITILDSVLSGTSFSYSERIKINKLLAIKNSVYLSGKMINGDITKWGYCIKEITQDIPAETLKSIDTNKDLLREYASVFVYFQRDASYGVAKPHTSWRECYSSDYGLYTMTRVYKKEPKFYILSNTQKKGCDELLILPVIDNKLFMVVGFWHTGRKAKITNLLNE
jgi:hypothetical protein